MPQIWLVTGSSRGLGLAIVEAALAAGNCVVATARRPEQLSHLVEQYGQDRVLPVTLDVTDIDEASRVMKAAMDKFGRVDVVVNNAGYADVSSIEDMNMKSFRAQFETNFFGVVNVTKAALPALRQQGFGHFIQVSSIGGRGASPGLSSYQSAKWALTSFSKVLALETAPFGIKVTVVEPGGIKTDWAGSSMGDLPLSEHYEETVGAFKKMRDSTKDQWTPPEEYAQCILRVASASKPPVRLLLGKQAAQIAKSVAEDTAASDKQWEGLTSSCN